MNMDLRTRKSHTVELGAHQYVDLNDRLAPMNSYYHIQDVVERLRDEYDWTHSFVRECYFATSHHLCEFVDDAGNTKIGDVYGPQDLRLVIACAGNATDTGIEFIFRDISVFSVQVFDELHFEYEFDVHSGHTVHFANAKRGRECYIIAKSVLVQFLGRTYLGIGLRLGFEFPTSEAFEAQIIEGCWRQCANCSNAWQENPRIEYSRCPACGELTKLKK